VSSFFTFAAVVAPRSATTTGATTSLPAGTAAVACVAASLVRTE